MFFISILIIVTFSIAACAAFFSVYGLAAIFSGVFWPVIIMGTSLEAGKLIAVSYLYRFKDTISIMMKMYLLAAILVLMFITSAGIFGYLSMAYQQDMLPLKQQQQQILLLENEQDELKQFKVERLNRRKQIDTDIAALPNNYITGRQRLLKSYKPELDSLKNDIERYTKQINQKTLKISELKQQQLISEVHTGPIIYISKVFNSNVDNATKWMIIFIIFAFDPLAVALTIAINNAFVQRKIQLMGYGKTNKSDIVDTPDNIITPTPSDIGIDDLKTALAAMQDKDLSPSELAQRSMLEEMLNKKMVTKKIRNPNNKS